jgi:gamma-glutamylputrescine oxidase
MSSSNTYYHVSAPEPEPRPPLEGTVETEVAVVGGGLAGLATALSLAERGRRVVVLEAKAIGAGASGRNGGMVSAGYAARASEIERAVGDEQARRLAALSEDAVHLVRARIDRHRIPCHPVDGIVVASWFEAPDRLEAEVEEHNRQHGTRLEFWPRERLRALYPSPRYRDGIFDPGGFHVDPLALTRGYALAAEATGGAQIHEGAPALALGRENNGSGRWRVATPRGAVLARTVVSCQSAYPPSLLPELARATLAVFTYIVVTEPLTGRHAGIIRAQHAVYDDRFATGYYRLLPDGRLLWGGRISIREQPRDLAHLMRRDLARVYPQLHDVRIDHVWSGRMGFARHKMPLIRELAPGLWVNSCFGGHGLNTTALGGELVASAIAEGDQRYRLLAPFTPRWAGGALGRFAAQAIYWRHALVDTVRATRQGRRTSRRDAGHPRETKTIPGG